MPVSATDPIRMFPKDGRQIVIRFNGGTNTTALNDMRAAHPDEDVKNGRNTGFEAGFSQDVVAIDKGKFTFVAGLGLRAGYEAQRGLVKIGEHQEWRTYDVTPYHDHDDDPHGHYHHHHQYVTREVTVNDYKTYKKGGARIVPEVTVGAKVALDSYGDFVLDVRGVLNANVIVGELNVGAQAGVTIGKSYTPFIGYEKQVTHGEGHRIFGGVGIKF